MACTFYSMMHIVYILFTYCILVMDGCMTQGKREREKRERERDATQQRWKT